MPSAQLNGVNIFYEKMGRGTPIILVHPPVLSSISFLHQMEGLSRNFLTVRFDIRGHGRSQASQQAITYPLIVEDIIHLMDHLEIKEAYLCGYSTGASIVLEFLLTHPNRALGGILVGGMSEIHDFRLATRIRLGILSTKIGAIRPLALSLSWSNSDTKGLMWKTYQESKLGNPKNMEQYYRASLHYNCTARLKLIHVPVLLVYGVEDHGFHSYSRVLHDRLPNSELTFVQNIKHQIPTKAAPALNKRIEQFVKTHEVSNF
ncbi:alpha/beta hydrolase [Alicyclobacillus fastidiosus]|uniref:Alpha/beta hydrolase n=1 Tax=Alicyclobacillus fastidiosus TaxID=392011 RepID=A0ABY6ZL54_9BACL|nr:alpha/beta hydrolase [Alicyclobacillus fastidiosus]WAH42851.1 alpha/beta hydrolase [Alicyclobacillus fastidiosus]